MALGEQRLGMSVAAGGGCRGVPFSPGQGELRELQSTSSTGREQAERGDSQANRWVSQGQKSPEKGVGEAS